MELKERNDEHKALIKHFDTEVKTKTIGEIRRVQCELDAALSNEQELKHELRDVNRRRSFARSCESQCVTLLEDKKILTRQIRHLVSEVASSAKKRCVVERSLLTMHASEISTMRATMNLQASDCVRKLNSAADRVEAADAEVEAASLSVASAKHAEEAARMAAEEAADDLAAAEQETVDAKWEAKLTGLREARLRKKLAKLASPSDEVSGKSADERAALNRNAIYQRDARERHAIRQFVESHQYEPRNLVVVLKEKNLLDKMIFQTREGYDVYFNATKTLLKKIEKEHYGASFALNLHYQHHMTMPAILKLTQAGCKKYDRESDSYKSKIALYHPFRKGETIKVFRLAPPASSLLPLKKLIEAESKVTHSENGRIARRSVETAYAELLKYGPGKFGMPTIGELDGSQLEVPFVGSWDATGHGKLQVSTAVLRNPYTPHSGQQLHILGVGNCDDGRSGVERLLGKENIFLINHWVRDRPVVETFVNGRTVRTRPRFYTSTDVSALRHGEHVAASGWCGCSRDFALRTTPPKPDSIAAMKILLGKCVSPTSVDRFVKSHSILPGENRPRPCSCCDFGHGADDDIIMAAYNTLIAQEKEMQSDRSKAGKARYSKWRMEYAKMHDNIQPGEFGRPQFEYDMDDFLLDLLHLAELGIPKTPWKHGILNNCSDDAREEIEELLSTFKHRIDCKRKDANRVTAEKWFTGEAWSSFCAGTKGSPGGPVAIAKCVKIFADDMQKRGVTIGAGTAEEEAAANAATTAKAKPKQGKAGKASKLATLAAQADPLAVQADSDQQVHLAKLASLTHQPTAMEKAANPEHLKIIREVYGSRAQTIINALLAFDAYFAWYYPLKELKDLAPFSKDTEGAELAAFNNCCRAIDMHEITERVTVRNHKSFLFHGAVYKVTRDILKVTNPWAFGIQALELQNAETKRVAQKNSARNLEFCIPVQTRVAMKHGQAGPMRLTNTNPEKKGTTMAVSILNFLLTKRYLQRGDGIMQLPESRISERVFGENSSGRSKLASAGMKLELLTSEIIPPRDDSCMAAFIREIAAVASAS